MSDVEDIQKVISTYSEGASRANWEQVVSTFLPDAVWSAAGTDMRMSGHTEMRSGFPKLLSTFEYIFQSNAPAVISVDGDRATARSVITEFAKMKDPAQSFVILGVYEDELVRSAAGWRFARRTYIKLATHD
jgi:hypothetical protein